MVVLVLAALAGIRIGRMTATLLMPWMGVEERLNNFDYMIATIAKTTGVGGCTEPLRAECVGQHT